MPAMPDDKQPLFSVAPMMAYTDRHYRFFARLISPHVLLYTEMLTAAALIHGDRQRLLRYNAEEHPLALQLGGSDPKQLAVCARLAEDAGFDELNLNVGCPSDRVQSGRFGACLMKVPDLVGECLSAMQSAVSIPVSVKTRIGVDDRDSYDHFIDFMKVIESIGCKIAIVHARKAWLKGLSPKENREIPPLRYDWVYRLKAAFPNLHVVLNGGVNTLAEVEDHLKHVDGVMLGRSAYHNPLLLAELEQRFYAPNAPVLTGKALVLNYLPYIAKQLEEGVSLRSMVRHILGLFQGCPGAKRWRRYLTEEAGRNDVAVVKRALELVG